MNTIEEQYWLTLDPEDLGSAVHERFKKYLDQLESMGRLGQARLARRCYDGGDHSGRGRSDRVTHGGEQGESSELTINHYGSLVTSVHAMVTQNRPAFTASAQDDSADSLASVQLVEQILEYELQRGAEEEQVDAMRRMLVLLEAGLGVFWHPEAGKTLVQAQPELDEMGMPAVDEDGEPKTTPEVKAGEMRTEAFSPYDVARDLGARTLDDITWQIVRRRTNKWDLAAIYPEHEGAILAAKNVDYHDLDRGLLPRGGGTGNSTSDTIYVLELYAERTPGCPNGRYARVVEDTCLEAGDLMYKRLPVGLHSSERSFDQALGSSRTADFLAPQEAYNAVMSNLLSNNDAFGRGNVITPDGSDLAVDDIGGGLQQVTYTPVEGAPEPHAMALPRLSPEDLHFAEALRSDMERMKAISSVVRGATDETIKSGAHAALIEAQAAKHNNGDMRAYAAMLKAWANRVIETYRTFATSERVIEVTGTDETKTAESFVGSDLEAVQSVDVQIANPYMRTIAGKKELADFYADPARWGDESLTMQQHMVFMSTGRLQPLFRSSRSQCIAIREENEAIARKEQVVALRTDNHKLHIQEHKTLLDGRTRMKLPPDVVQALDEHIRAHESLWVQLTIQEPYVLAATGQEPAPLPMAPMGPPPGGPSNDNGSPPAANDNAQPPLGPGQQPPQPTPPPGTPGAPPVPGMQPQMPKNPATGKRAPAAGGMQ